MKRVLNRMKPDYRERFLKFETLRGLLRVGAAIYVTYITVTDINFSIQVVFVLGSTCVLIEGLRDIFVNPIKQAVDRKRMITLRERRK